VLTEKGSTPWDISVRKTKSARHGQLKVVLPGFFAAENPGIKKELDETNAG
jgi:hypothetical protein